MAKYLISVLDTATGSAMPDEMASIDAFNDRLRSDGHWVMATGLADPGEAVTVDGRGAEATFTDGPFVALEEYVSGFWILDAPDRDTALRLAAAASRACNRRVELRPFHG